MRDESLFTPLLHHTDELDWTGLQRRTGPKDESKRMTSTMPPRAG